MVFEREEPQILTQMLTVFLTLGSTRSLILILILTVVCSWLLVPATMCGVGCDVCVCVRAGAVTWRYLFTATPAFSFNFEPASQVFFAKHDSCTEEVDLPRVIPTAALSTD